ncbi:MAG TPA: lactonase family protein [Pirellulales bacterium]|jgi:6-phosphogluconolactonase|nr:lactonase family protein [Pirellulales bacterium]
MATTRLVSAADQQPEEQPTKVANPHSLFVYIGTYTHGKGEHSASKGIYTCRFDLATGKLTIAGVTPSVEPSFLAIDPSRRFLYAVNEIENFGGKKAGGVSAFAIDLKSGELKPLNQQSSEGGGPCHLSVDRQGKHVLVANYGGGSLAVLPIEKYGRLGKATAFVQHQGSSVDPQRQEGPHAHSISLDAANHFALAADLGLDKLFVYRFDPEKGTLTPNNEPWAKLARGSGPRHFVFAGERFVYVINEMASTITAFAYDAEHGTLKSLQTVSTLPTGFSGSNTTAEIEIHPSGRFLYGSNRGHNSIVTFSIDPTSGLLTYVGHQPCGGKTPRSFGIDPTGTYLLAANQDSDSVVVMRIDPQTGKLTPTGDTVQIGMPVCVKMIPAPD